MMIARAIGLSLLSGAGAVVLSFGAIRLTAPSLMNDHLGRALLGGVVAVVVSFGAHLLAHSLDARDKRRRTAAPTPPR